MLSWFHSEPNKRTDSYGPLRVYKLYAYDSMMHFHKPHEENALGWLRCSEYTVSLQKTIVSLCFATFLDVRNIK